MSVSLKQYQQGTNSPSAIETYSSARDFKSLRAALIERGEPTLTAAKEILSNMGVSWPINYNTSQEKHVLALDEDLSDIFYSMRKKV